MTTIYLIGTGGHGQVVLDALLEAGIPSAAVVASDGAVEREGCTWLGLTVNCPEISPDMFGEAVHVAIGDSTIRQRLTGRACDAGAIPASILHPSANVSRFATLGAGVFIAAAAVVAPETRLGTGVIVNHGAVVDHDCDISDFAHLAPNSSLGGGVRIGARTLVGAGAVILPHLTIGHDVTIGAGAVVTRDVAAGQTWTGVPARLKYLHE